jgi:Tol biopolymer transport system component
VAIDRATDSVHVLRAAAPGVVWAAPRWDPSGRRIVVCQSWGGRYGVAVIDTADRVEVALGGDRALSMQPTWSRDGRWVLFSSDRTGVANLYACDPENPSVLRQVTNLVTGAYCPEVSPDGRWIYFSLYHADGWHVARIPYAPESWRAAPPRAARLAAGRPSP